MREPPLPRSTGAHLPTRGWRSALLAALADDHAPTVEEPGGPETSEQVAAAVLLLGLGLTAVHVWSFLPTRLRDTPHPTLLWLSAGAVTLCAGLLSPRALGVLTGRLPRSSSMWWWYTWRVSLSVLLVVGGVVVLPGWHALGLWPLGVALGADLALGCWSLGVQVRPVEWWVKILTSPVHLACLGALAALAITRQDSSVIIGTIGLVAAFEMAIAIAIGVATLLLHAAESIDVEKEERSEQRLRAERLNLAHWIHDDVCADLQLTSLRLRTGQLSAVEVAAELADLDHRLRLRQQRELIESGEARLAELLQPYVRRAQTAGVSIVAVPRLDDVDVRVDTDTATLFARTLANLVSNSLNAGASELGIEVQVETDGLRVVVTDNAGGFDENDIPPGRGLDSLIAHLGRDHLTVERTTTGSQVTVVIPLLRDGGRVGGAPVAG